MAGHENVLETVRFKNEKYNSTYQGIVRNSHDITKPGIIKVEVLPMMKGLPTKDLPWAIPKWPSLNRTQMPQEGTTVWVFFQEGDILKPVYESNGIPIKALGDQATTPNQTPEGTPHTHEGHDLGDPIYHQERADSIKALENQDRVGPVEPLMTAAPIYPYNDIFLTPGGMMVEFDDTEGNRRYHLYHPGGSFTEMTEDGDVHTRAGRDSKAFARGVMLRYAKGELILQSEKEIQLVAPKINMVKG